MGAPTTTIPVTEVPIGMERRSLDALARALESANARYLIVGGMAVVAHGYVRLTVDVDLVLDPEPAALVRALEALSNLGYRPRAPVPIAAFADAEQRKRWASEKGLTVFSLFSPEHKATEVDLFLECPFDFEEAFARAFRSSMESGTTLTFVSKADLIALKRAAGRPRDLLDIEKLEAIPSAVEGSDE